MSNDQNQNSKYTIDIYERTYEFSIKVIKFTRKFQKTVETDVIKKQLIRSATSVSANLQEADGARTRADFTHTVSISKKEAKETKLWIRLIGDLYPQLKNETEDLIEENEQIIKILAKIVINSSKSL